MFKKLPALLINCVSILHGQSLHWLVKINFFTLVVLKFYAGNDDIELDPCFTLNFLKRDNRSHSLWGCTQESSCSVVPVQSWMLFCLNIALVEKCRFRSVKIWLWNDVDIKFVSNRHFWVKAKIVCLLFPKGECFIKTFTLQFWNSRTNKNNLKTSWHFIWLKMIDGRKRRRAIREYFMLENCSPLFACLFQVLKNETIFFMFWFG